MEVKAKMKFLDKEAGKLREPGERWETNRDRALRLEGMYLAEIIKEPAKVEGGDPDISHEVQG